jgi:transposase InsO family protein
MKKGKVWRHPEIFQPMAVEPFKCCENIERLATELGVARQTLYRWHKKSECADEGQDAVLEKSRESRLRREIRDLKRVLAEKVWDRPNQWVADITYVRLNREFVYLAVVLDKFSRRVVGWALDRTLSCRLPLAALTNALEDRKPGPGLVQHSDRGAQYLNASYVATLRKYSIIASISRPANPGDNANCESFFRTLKREEIRTREYAQAIDLEERRHFVLLCAIQEASDTGIRQNLNLVFRNASPSGSDTRS